MEWGLRKPQPWSALRPVFCYIPSLGPQPLPQFARRGEGDACVVPRGSIAVEEGKGLVCPLRALLG